MKPENKSRAPGRWAVPGGDMLDANEELIYAKTGFACQEQQ